ncbi:MAG: hypothetical protein SPE59_09490 [Treponema sp.]|nr:hypothetical protein [Treponema sp.]
MKKIINAIIVSVCMLCVTGCSMLIAGNNKADVKESYKEDLTANVADGNTAQEPFKVSDIRLENGSDKFDENSDSTTYFNISFNADVAKESVSGITVYELKDETESAAGIYKVSKTLDFSSVVLNDNVCIGVNLKNVDAIEIFVDAAKVTAKNGQKLDMDGDKTGAEVEDSYSKYFAKSLFSFDSSKQRKFQRDNTLAQDFDVIFGKSTAKGLVDEVTVKLGISEDLSSMLKENTVVQKFDASSKTWTDVAYTDAVYSAGEDTHILKFTAIPEGSFCRLVTKDAGKIKTVNKYQGYERVYTTDCKVQFEILEPAEYSTAATVDQDFFDSISVDSSITNMNEKKSIEINSITFSIKTSNASFSNDKGYDDSYTVTGVQDMDVINHVKFYDTNLNPITVSADNVRTLYSDEFTYGVSGDKTGYKKVTYYFKKPVTLPKYNTGNESLYIYADKDLTIKFYTYSGSTEKGEFEYKMGTSYDAEEALLDVTEGRKKLSEKTINY